MLEHHNTLAMCFGLQNAQLGAPKKLRKRFTVEEDKIIRKYAVSGTISWEAIATMLPGRTGQQVKDRYNGYLAHDVSQRPWSKEEDEKIWELYKERGPKWTSISRELLGRSGANVKNRWYKILRKRHMEPEKDENTKFYSETPDYQCLDFDASLLNECIFLDDFSL